MTSGQLREKSSAPLKVGVATDGRRDSSALIMRGGIVEEIDGELILRASCSVHHLADGTRRITATVWTRPEAQA